MPFLPLLISTFGPKIAETITQKIFNKPVDEVVEADITPEQKNEMMQMAAQMQSEINQTMRVEAQSEHWLVRSWRPITIYGLGALVMSIVSLHEFGGIYFLFQEKELWDKFHVLLQDNERESNLLMTGFFALCGIYFPLRSAEKGTFNKIKGLFKQ